uniref:non-specific serine/threonine protein kinase n=1 Tax=Cannabis sativa TaxID=3483 RepID=A0A803P055_CANSA
MQLFSASGIFRLGFFQLGSSSKSNLSYLGIWYNNNGHNEKPVWIANRNNPIPDESGTLRIDQNGNLMISHKAGHPIITLYSVQSPINATATLLDSGNFVLRSDDITEPLWQSFDYPTDTLLPKMKLGFDKRRGTNRTLTSWRTDDFPALGSFTLAVDHSIGSDQMIMWWRGSKYWTSGPWREESEGCFDSFKGEFCNHYKYKFSYVSNEEETYFNYSNCSCVAYASTNDDIGTGCEIWSKDSSFTNSNLVGFREIRLLESTVDMWWIWVTGLTGGTATFPLLISSLYIVLRKCKAKRNRQRMEQDLLLQELGKVGERHSKDGNELQLLSFEIISSATNGFSASNKLGGGGFGPVYKGKLVDGQEVAVKRLSKSSRQGLVEFKNEVLLIAKLQHTNLVRLLGFCIEGEERSLIYEYMPNKSLDLFLFDERRRSLLSWEKRFSIIGGIAQGLVYLHKYSRLKVIHRDLKPSNILLDKEMNPKISDFGMARIFGLNVSEENTNRVVGTYGYMSPEYAIKGIVSVKTDVFSFGVILLEIISGKKNNSRYHTEKPLNLIGYAWQLWSEGRGVELVDSSLAKYKLSEVLIGIHIGLLCVQERPEDRPTMPDVVSMIHSDTTLLPSPKQPVFFINYLLMEDLEVGSQKIDNCSLNDLTLSVVEAR